MLFVGVSEQERYWQLHNPLIWWFVMQVVWYILLSHPTSILPKKLSYCYVKACTGIFKLSNDMNGLDTDFTLRVCFLSANNNLWFRVYSTQIPCALCKHKPAWKPNGQQVRARHAIYWCACLCAQASRNYHGLNVAKWNGQTSVRARWNKANMTTMTAAETDKRTSCSSSAWISPLWPPPVWTPETMFWALYAFQKFGRQHQDLTCSWHHHHLGDSQLECSKSLLNPQLSVSVSMIKFFWLLRYGLDTQGVRGFCQSASLNTRLGVQRFLLPPLGDNNKVFSASGTHS